MGHATLRPENIRVCRLADGSPGMGRGTVQRTDGGWGGAADVQEFDQCGGRSVCYFETVQLYSFFEGQSEECGEDAGQYCGSLSAVQEIEGDWMSHTDGPFDAQRFLG